MKRLVAMALVVLAQSACGYRTCGTVEVLAPDDPERVYDADGDGDLDFIQACGANYGNFGSYYPEFDLVHIFFATDHYDVAEGVDVAYDYLLVTDVWARWAHFEEGATLTEANLAGNGLLKPNGLSEELPLAFALSEGTIEVTGPLKEVDREGIFAEDERIEFRIRWDLAFGDPSRPRMHYVGEDVLRVALDDIVFQDADDFTVLPPDYVAP